MPSTNKNHADLILHNGRITTLDPKHPEATSLTVKDGRFIGVDDAEKYMRGPNREVIDLKGRRVIPGLNDSHLHVIRGGLNYNMELRWDGVPHAHRPVNGFASSVAGVSFSLRSAGCRHWRKSMPPHPIRRFSSCIFIAAHC